MESIAALRARRRLPAAVGSPSELDELAGTPIEDALEQAGRTFLSVLLGQLRNYTRLERMEEEASSATHAQ